jgi:hypothetical protein
MVRFFYKLLCLMFLVSQSFGCVVSNEELSRIETLKPTSVSKVLPVELRYKQIRESGEESVMILGEHSNSMRLKVKNYLETLGNAHVTEGGDYKLFVTLKDRNDQNLFWLNLSVTALFLVPYHGSNTYTLEAQLKRNDEVIKRYDLDDKFEVYVHLLLAPAALFQWPRNEMDIQENMLKNLAVRVSEDLRTL